MNQLAIDDLLAGILARWCESVAEWEPPGQGSSHTCTTCPGSILAEVMDISAWPHDLMHQLSEALDCTAFEICESWDSESVREYGGSVASVRRYVADTVRDRQGDLTDVLIECVEPRIAAFTSREVRRALARVDS